MVEAAMGRVVQLAERAVHAIEGQRWLDVPSYKLEHGYALVLNLLGGASEHVRSALHGTWYGHPVHPPLTDIPVGAWTTALVFDPADLVGDSQQRRDAARDCIAVGLAGAGASAVTGLTDWQYTHDNARRVGLVHGLLNLLAAGLYTGSWLARGRERYSAGFALSMSGYVIAGGSAYLGGSLVSRHKIGTDHSDNRLEPRTFTAVIAERELPEGKPVAVETAGTTVMLVRKDGKVRALSEMCSHLGGPLSEGWLYRNSIVCPWHGSRFDLDDGRVLAGPATAPVPCLQARVRAGQVEIRRRPPVTAAPPGSVVAREQDAADARD